jgi:hypothetical protein
MAPVLLAAAVLVLVFAGASFFFALAETALFSLSKWQARQLAEFLEGRFCRGWGITYWHEIPVSFVGQDCILRAGL